MNEAEFHCREASRLLSKLEDHQLELRFARARIAAAHAHAATAAAWAEVLKGYDDLIDRAEVKVFQANEDGDMMEVRRATGDRL